MKINGAQKDIPFVKGYFSSKLDIHTYVYIQPRQILAIRLCVLERCTVHICICIGANFDSPAKFQGQNMDFWGIHNNLSTFVQCKDNNLYLLPCKKSDEYRSVRHDLLDARIEFMFKKLPSTQHN